MKKEIVASSDKATHIQGRYLVITALIGLVGVFGGYFIKGNKCKEYCNPGGLWTSASTDMEMVCSIFEKKDSFNIQLQNGMGGFLHGRGKLRSGAGVFTANDFDSEKPKRKAGIYEGEISMQGCNNLSVSVWLINDRNSVYTFSFVRGSLENIKVGQNEK